MSIGFFVLTLFDLHTTRALVPVFFTGLAFVPGGFILLALRLPGDAPVITRFPAIERIVDVVGFAVAVLFVSLWATNRATTGVQYVWTSACSSTRPPPTGASLLSTATCTTCTSSGSERPPRCDEIRRSIGGDGFAVLG